MREQEASPNLWHSVRNGFQRDWDDPSWLTQTEAFEPPRWPVTGCPPGGDITLFLRKFELKSEGYEEAG